MRWPVGVVRSGVEDGWGLEGGKEGVEREGGKREGLWVEGKGVKGVGRE